MDFLLRWLGERSCENDTKIVFTWIRKIIFHIWKFEKKTIWARYPNYPKRISKNRNIFTFHRKLFWLKKFKIHRIKKIDTVHRSTFLFRLNVLHPIGHCSKKKLCLLEYKKEFARIWFSFSYPNKLIEPNSQFFVFFFFNFFFEYLKIVIFFMIKKELGIHACFQIESSNSSFFFLIFLFL